MKDNKLDPICSLISAPESKQVCNSLNENVDGNEKMVQASLLSDRKITIKRCVAQHTVQWNLRSMLLLQTVNQATARLLVKRHVAQSMWLQQQLVFLCKAAVNHD